MFRMLNDIPLPILWLGLAVLLGIIEAGTLGLVTIWFAIGSLIAMLVALAGLGFQWQFTAFMIASLVLLYFTKPFLKKFLKQKTERTNADMVLGEKGKVVQRISHFNNTGQVRVKGQIWTAKAFDRSEIEVDELVEVLEINGVTLLVRKINIIQGVDL